MRSRKFMHSTRAITLVKQKSKMIGEVEEAERCCFDVERVVRWECAAAKQIKGLALRPCSRINCAQSVSRLPLLCPSFASAHRFLASSSPHLFVSRSVQCAAVDSPLSALSLPALSTRSTAPALSDSLTLPLDSRSFVLLPSISPLTLPLKHTPTL